MTTIRRRALPLLLACLAPALTGCIRIAETPAYLRMLNASPDYTALDLYVDDEQELGPVAYESISDYLEVDSGNRSLTVTRSGVTSTLLARDETLDDETRTTLVLYGATGDIGSLLLDEELDAPDSGEARLQVYHVATDAGSLDVYLTDATADLADVSPTYSALEAGAAAAESPLTLDSGTYRLRIVGTGSKKDLRFDSGSITLASRTVYNLLVTPARGGVLVNAALLPQHGTMSFLRNAAARVRAAVGVEDATSVALSAGGTALLSAAPYTTLGTYRLVTAGDLALDLSVDGSPVDTATVTALAGADYTLLLTGTTDAPTQTLLEDVNRLPDAGYARLRLVHAMGGLDDPLSLAVDYFPLVQGVEPLASLLSEDFESTTGSVLDVTDASTSAKLFTATDVTLSSGSVYTLLMLGRTSATTGVLRKDR